MDLGYLSALLPPPLGNRKLRPLCSSTYAAIQTVPPADSQGVSVLTACSPSFKSHSPALPAAQQLLHFVQFYSFLLRAQLVTVPESSLKVPDLSF